MTLSRRSVLQGLSGLAISSAWSGVGRAQGAYPTAPLRCIIPTAAGGGYDTMMRVVGQQLHATLGQPFIVESRPGASGAIAARAVATSPPDGYTLLVMYSSVLTNPLLMSDAGYALSDLQVVTRLTNSPIALCVRRSLGVQTLADLVALAQREPGTLSYASYGPGSGGHFVGELFKRAANVDLAHAPYRGEAPALQDLLGEHVDCAVISVGAASRHPDNVLPLAVSGARSQRYPDIPAFAEVGYPEVNLPGFAAVFVAAGTPPEIVQRLEQQLNAAAQRPEIAEQLLALGFEPLGWDVAQSQHFLDEQLVTVRSLIDEGRIKL